MKRLLPLLLLLTGCVHSQSAQLGGSGKVGGTGQIGTVNTTPGSIAILQLPDIAFPSTQTGVASAGQVDTLTNTGAAVSNLQGFLIGGTNASDFAITVNGCGSTLAPGASCDITLTFTPGASGARTGSLTVLSDAQTNPSAGLMGTGLTPPQPDTTLLPATLTFPDTNTGSSSASQDATLTNTGTGTLNISSITISGTNAGDYSKTTTCGATLAVSATCTISITFTPTATGARVAQLNVASDSVSTPNVTTFTGNGTTPAAPQVSLTASLTFPDTTQGVTSQPMTAILQNTGNATLSITSISLGGANPGDFAQTNTCGATLIAGASCNINVTFTPTTTGARSASISVADSATGSPHTSALSGTGTAPIPTLVIQTSALTNCTEGTSCPQQIQVTGGVPPYFYTTPAGAIPSGAIDVLDWMVMPLPDRNSFHLTGNAVKYFHVDNGLVWWLKGSSGGPWDGEMYDANYIYQWFTEGPTFSNLSGYKRYRVPVPLWPRYFVPGSDVVTTTPGPNLYDITESCGSDNLSPIDNQDIKGELTGPFTDVTWLTTYGGSIPDGTPYLLAVKYIKGVNGLYQNRERYWLVQGFGQVKWEAAHLSGTSYVVDSSSVNSTKTSGGAPTPNFACTVPALPETGNLPPGTVSSGSPQMRLNDATGAIAGTPNKAGSFPFTLQVEDSVGQIKQQNLSIGVVCPAFSISGNPGPATQGLAYSFTFTSSGGILPLSWSESGALPTGITFSNGTLSGTSTQTGTFPIIVTATDSCSPSGTSQQLNVSLIVNANSGALTITTASLPQGVSGSPYSFTLGVTGGTGPYTWARTAGTWPTGCSDSSLNSSSGAISCTPTQTGTFALTFQVTDSLSATANKALSLVVVAPVGTKADNRYCTASETASYPGGATVDDIADLPTACVRSDIANTPSSGTTINVAAGNATALQNALNTAACGQVIVLQAGSTYTGSFTFPAHSCDSTHWITVETSALSALPAEGVRATPCYANTQLPSRPASPAGPGNCNPMIAAMARLKGNGTFDETARFATNSDHYRVIGIEIEAQTKARPAQVQNIVNMQAGSNHLIFDRVWIHGLANQATVRAGFMADGVNHIALIDSSVTDIHCIQGVCTDSQIFQGGFGSSAKAAFKGVNNYVESAGTNSMSFGGGKATVMPTDFEWRRNYEYKPMIWNPACVAPLPPTCKLPDGTPVTYDGLGPYSVKNIFEIKNIIRALIEGNVMENNWMHADQNATAILLTPKNQSGNLCPLCVERHITIRYNHIISSGGFLQAVNASADDGGLATEGSHYSIHDNLAENLNFQGVVNKGFSFATYTVQTWSNINLACNSSFVQHDVHIFHNTLLSSRTQNAMHQMDGPAKNPNPCESGMVFRDNIGPYGSQGMNQVSNTACAGPTSTQFATKLSNCWTAPFTHTKNAIIGGTGTWPTGNILLSNAAAARFVNYSGGAFGDYRLCTAVGSPTSACTAASILHNASTDGKDIGADVNTMLQNTAGVSPYN